MRSFLVLPILLRLAFLILALGAPLALRADVEPIRILINTSASKTEPGSYTPPPGKVLIIEHIAFSDRWQSSGNAMELVIGHISTSPSDNVQTTLTYTSAFNTLFRPLKITDQIRIAPKFNKFGYFVAIYGLLVDVEDLYAAAVPAEADPERVITQRGGGEELQGTVDIASSRPVQIEAEVSPDLSNWESGEGATIARTESTRVHRFALPLDPVTDRNFVRFSARALVRDDYLGAPRHAFLAGPTGVGTMAPNGTVVEPAIPNGVAPSPITEEG